MCKDVYEFWKRICNWWNTLDYDDVDFPAFPNAKTVIFGAQCITETVAVLNFCMFHIKYYIYRQRVFQHNVFHLHEIQKTILAKLEIEKKNICQKENKNYKFDKFEILYDNLKWLSLDLKINLPTMEGIAFVFTNTSTREQNIGFHGNNNHVTKTCGTT